MDYRPPQNQLSDPLIDHSIVRRSRFSFYDLPIKYRLPLIIGTLLFSIILASIWASYRAVKESALAVGRERLLSLTQQLATQSQQANPITLGKIFTAANDPAIRAFLRSPSGATRAGALAQLQTYSAAQDPSTLQVELWSANRALVLTAPDGLPAETLDLEAEFSQCSAAPFSVAGPIQLVKDVVAFPALAAVQDESGKLAGFLVKWRRVAPSANARKQISELLGNQTALYYGNSRGDGFTDLERIVPRPPVSLNAAAEVTHYMREGQSVMALGRPIVGTPWFVVVEIPDQVILKPANQILRRMLLIGSSLFVVGVGAAVLFTRNITGPLQLLTAAASAIGGGDYSRKVQIRQNDELGELANAFNLMVAKLRHSQLELEKKASLFDQTYDAALVWDWNGPITFWNLGAERVYGFTGAEALGKSPHELLQTELVGGVESLTQSLAKTAKWEGELQHVTRAGVQIVVESRMVLVPEKGNEYVIEITRDITERGDAVRALSQSERQYRLLFDYNPMPLWICDRETLRFLAVNEAAISHYGFSRQEFLVMTMADICEPQDLPQLKHDLALLAAGPTHRGSWSHRIKGDAVIEVAMASHAIEFGERAADLISAEDITERKLAERAKQASELRYRRLFESAKDGILILEADTGSIVDANPYIIATLGYALEELIGKQLWEIGVFEDIPESKVAFAELQTIGYIRYDDLPLKSRDGLITQVEFVSNVYSVGDSKVIQCNIRNITARKRAEKALAETNHKLEASLFELTTTTQQLWQASKLATMGELSASIAHELNNPLATVALRVEHLSMEIPADDPKTHSLEIISQEVDRMALLVNDLLQFSRRSHRQESTVDVGEEVQNTVEFVQYHLRSRKIEVVREFPDSLPTIQADRQQLRQLFLNILTNASDAMPAGGRLIVRTGLGVLHDLPAVSIHFEDTGEGIPAENLGKIWDSFFTTKPEGKGTGLGLAICRRIVEEHRGTIDVESLAGVGTTVRILIPATTNGLPDKWNDE